MIAARDPRWKVASTELHEMEGILKKHGYDPKDAKSLLDEGMGPGELEHRIKTTKPGEMGSLEYTHKLKKLASSPEQWEAAALILEQKAEHGAIKVIKNGFDAVLKAIDEADKRSKNLKKVGVGRTEDPNLVLAEVEPAIRELGEECLAIAKQMKERFGGV